MCSCVDKINSEFIVERVLRATENGKERKNNQPHQCQKKKTWNFCITPPLDLLTKFRTGFDVQSEPREMDRIWCRLYLCQKKSASIFARLHLDKSHFQSRAPLLQEERFQLDMSRLTS